MNMKLQQVGHFDILEELKEHETEVSEQIKEDSDAYEAIKTKSDQHLARYAKIEEILKVLSNAGNLKYYWFEAENLFCRKCTSFLR